MRHCHSPDYTKIQPHFTPMHWPQFYFRRYFATNDFTEFQFTTFSLVRSILAAAQLFSSVGLRYTLSLEWCDLLAFVVGRLGKAAEVRGRRSRTSNLESSSTTHLLCAVCSSKNSSVCNFVMFTDISNCRICLCFCLIFGLYDVSFESLDLQTSFWYALQLHLSSSWVKCLCWGHQLKVKVIQT